MLTAAVVGQHSQTRRSTAASRRCFPLRDRNARRAAPCRRCPRRRRRCPASSRGRRAKSRRGRSRCRRASRSRAVCACRRGAEKPAPTRCAFVGRSRESQVVAGCAAAVHLHPVRHQRPIGQSHHRRHIGVVGEEIVAERDQPWLGPARVPCARRTSARFANWRSPASSG